MTPTLTILQGLPGSGKTTWAKDQIAERPMHPIMPRLVRVNKDDIRRELERAGWVWSKGNEQKVREIRDSRIENALDAGYDVISDDTNFGKHPQHLTQLAQTCGVRVDFKSFSTPVDECLRRNALRKGNARVPDMVIKNMAAKYRPDLYRFALYAPRPTARPAVMCDLDGTLALFEAKGHRGPYDATLADQDECNESVRQVLRAMEDRLVVVLYVSGRSAKYRQPTVRFLQYNACPIPQRLFMRDADDSRPDWIVKGELFDTHVRDQFNVLFVLDDRDQVVNFWRGIGLQCWQVAPGAF